MVVILLLTPHTFNGCDGGSNESSTLSTTSTGATAIPTNLYTSYQKKRSHNEIPAQSTYLPAHPQHHHNSSQHPASCNRCTNNKIVHLPTCHWPTSNICTCHYTYDNQNKNPVRTYISCYPTTQHNAAYQNLKSYQYNVYTPDKQLSLPSASSSLSPTPPPLPKSKPPYELYYNSRQRDGDGYHRVNAVPKPPRCQQRSTHQRIQITTNNNKDKNCLPDNCLRTIPAVCRKNANKENIFNYLGNLPKQSRKIPSSSKNTSTNTTDYVRHVTRVNFYDIDTLQVEFEPKDDDAICDTEAITKEEEWVTKRKTELTTTRQIETRVKRQVVLKDGKVVGDSGPIVSTNTTEDTDKQETETTEKKDFGQPNNHVSVTASTQGAIEDAGTSRQLAVPNENVIKKLLPRPADGLLRETKEKRVISREEVKDYLETEAVQHLGDFSDENYIKAINNSTDNLEETLLTAGNQKHLVPTGPKVIANTSKSYKTIDTEDTEKRCFARPDGTLVTENKNTTEHEVIADEDLPEKDNQLEGPSHELTKTVEARQRFYKQRDEQNVDILANGKLIGTEMRYAAETMQIEKDGSLERPGDWDSLSDRMRKLRKPQKTLLQQQKEAAALMADRKDALTKRPLDFDREEETRKGETMKWLESHFGSESTASNDSRDETEVEPTKRTYFNVTIKSNYAQNESQTATAAANLYDKKYHQQQKETDIIHMGASGSAGKTKYYQGISNWIDRKNSQPPTNHFATKAFRDDLKETVERNRLKRVDIKTNSREQLYTGGGIGEGQHLPEPKDTYVSREDILNQKRQSLSSQFLARTKRGSLNTADLQNQVDSKLDYRSGSHTDIRYVTNEHQHQRFQNNQRTNNHFRSLETAAELPVNTVGRNVDYEPTMGGRIRKSMAENSDTFDHSATSSRFLNDTLAPITLKKEPKRIPSPDPLHMQSKTLDRPKVPQRKRAVERKLRQQFSAPPESTIVFDHFSDRAEPPPDYSPPPRSRSASPQIDYITSSEGRDIRTDTGGNNTVNTTRKLNQRTRFAPTHPSDLHQSRPKMSTQTTQTTPSTISSASATTSHKSHNKVGQAIGNSLRKLVGKIRSASAERMFRMKSKSKSREQSPSTLDNDKEVPNANSTTYQQYNLIDSHIGSGGQTNGHESEQESAKLSPQQSYMITSSNTNLSTVRRDAPTSMRSISGSTTLNRDKPKAVNRDETTEDFYANQRDIDAVINPRQRYYLGEDPYSSKLYGKENMYDPTSVGKRYREHEPNPVRRNNMENFEKRNDKEREPYTHNRYTTSNTLGRYQKSSQRLVGSTPNLSNDYRTAKTLPRKLADHQEYQHPQQQIMGSSQLDGLVHYQPTTVGPGPAKPVRSYTKVLNRSKSFNLHGLNGSTENNNTPIYMGKSNEKQRINAMANSNTNLSYAYKREPTYLSNSYKDNTLQQSGLKSPSIVNLISRSQKDLTKIGSIEDENEFIDKYDVRDTSNTRRLRSTEQNEKKNIFLRGLHQQAPDLFKTLHGDEDLRLQHTSKISSAQRKYPLKVMHSVEPRSPIQINKDTASIIRGSIYETDPYVSPQSQPLTLANKEKVHLYGEDQKRRGSGSTVIEINRK